MIKKANLLKAVVIAVLAVSMIGLAACGDKSEDSGGKAKKYTVVTEPTFPPFDTTNEDGDIEGFDMDLLNAVAKDQGFEVKYKAIEFDALIPAVETEQADIIAAGMNAMDPARQKKVDFSDTYYDSGLTVLVKSNNGNIKSKEDFTADMKIAGQIATTSAKLCKKLKKEGKIADAVILNKNSEAIMQLKNGDVQAMILDLPVANAYIAKDNAVKKVGKVINAESYGFAVHKGNKELLDKINKGLKNVKDNGTYDKLYKKWFKG